MPQSNDTKQEQDQQVAQKEKELQKEAGNEELEALPEQPETETATKE